MHKQQTVATYHLHFLFDEAIGSYLVHFFLLGALLYLDGLGLFQQALVLLGTLFQNVLLLQYLLLDFIVLLPNLFEQFNNDLVTALYSQLEVLLEFLYHPRPLLIGWHQIRVDALGP